MKIVNNMTIDRSGKAVEGEVVKGNVTGGLFLVVDSGTRLLSLQTLSVMGYSNDNFSNYTRTGIKRENITITFEGANN